MQSKQQAVLRCDGMPAASPPPCPAPPVLFNLTATLSLTYSTVRYALRLPGTLFPRKTQPSCPWLARRPQHGIHQEADYHMP